LISALTWVKSRIYIVQSIKSFKFAVNYIEGFKAPFVQENHFKIGIKFVDAIDISNGIKLVIGEIESKRYFLTKQLKK